MKKILSLLLAAILVLAAVFMLTVPALADTGGGAESPEFFTWAMLGTYAGALAATGLITQLLKDAHIFEKIPKRIFAWMIAFPVLLAANYITGTLTIESAILCAINAVVVGLAANGGYDLLATFKKSTTQKNE